MDNKNKKFKSYKNLGATVYIGNLNYDRDENGIKFLFSRYGKVKSIEIATDSGKSKGYAFVKMFEKEEAELAVKELNGEVVDGRTLKVSIAKEREYDDTPVESTQPTRPAETKRPEPEPKTYTKRKKKGNLQDLFDYQKSKKK